MPQFLPSTRPSRNAVFTALAIGVAILLRLLLISASVDHVPATSDEASVVLQAKEIVRGNFPLLFMGQPLLFPVEAYTMAPLVEWLPRNTWGARYQTFLLGSLSVIGFLLLARRVFAKSDRWPVYLLILFPSSYLLLLTAGYAPPQYPTSLALAWVSFLLVLRHRRRPNVFLLLIAGAASGLAMSNHLLFLPVALGAFSLVLFNGKLEKGVKESLPFGLGAGLGLTPFLAAMLFIPGAYQGFLPALSLHDTFDNLVAFVLSESFAGAMGMYPTLFPDFRDSRMVWIKELRVAFAFGYVVLCGYLLTLRLYALIHNLRNKVWPELQPVDAALLISLLTIVIFASHDNEYFAFRYLLHAVWCFPFLVGCAYASSSGRSKQCIAVMAVCCAVFNIACSAKMIRQWRKPGRINAYADLQPLEPVLSTLSSMRIEHCYASFWVAYRISLATDEKIKCTGPYNERFAGWPIPYKQEVDEDEKSVYILTQTLWARHSALEFEANTAAQGIGYEKIEVGDRSAPFYIYHRFSEGDHPPERLASIEEVVDCRKSGYRPGDQAATATPCLEETWGDLSPLFHITLTAPHTLTRLRLEENPLLASLEENLHLAVRHDGHWRLLEHGVDYSFLRLSFAHGHPIYHEGFRLIRFQETTGDALRLGLGQLPASTSGKSPTFTLHAKP